MTDTPGSRPDRRRRRRLLAGLAANTLITLAGAIWLVVTGHAAEDDLTAVRAAADRLQADLLACDVQGAVRESALMRRWAASARRATSGFVWDGMARLPVVGRPARTVQGVAVAVDELTRTVLPPLTDAARVLGTRMALTPGGAVDLAAVRAVAGRLTDAASHIAVISRELTDLPDHTGIDRIDRGRAELMRQTSRLEQVTSTSATAARLVPPMAGDGRPRRYFFALQTNAEARGSGGLVGAYSVLAADQGRLGFERFSADDALPAAAEPVVRLGADFDRRYGAAHSTQLLSESNLSPNFPYAGQIWTGLWQSRTGESLDGAIASDPVGLADLLAVTGPVPAPSGGLLSADNAVAYTERDIYARYPDTSARKRALTEIAQSVATALTRQRLTTPAVFKALAAMVDDGRLQVWSSHPEEEALLSRTAIGGVLPDTSRPFAELVVNNAAAGKLDFYLARRLEYRLGGCGNGGRPATVRIQLTNSAPRTGLPDYVVNRGDDPGHPHARGSDFSWVSFYATHGAELVGADLDGHPQLLAVDQERGHPVFSAALEVLPGQTRVLTLHLDEPAKDAAPLTPVQPLAQRQTTVVIAPPCTDR
ncbi:DUF4012 domain-containing protein [Streptomyces orinoci]|uniref:DUF4012 domain-containing protein n=1 Tax=Streptomyces orinoci TaxID=67339 RepID=A0ABV3JZX8_STRON|nr:DUF4012 domain-containing protein [Streptomyces orinoci]